jgi:carboxyl-terminal processing protease
VQKVRGAKGTTVVITVVRGEDAPKDISIVRDVIVVPAVEPKQLSTAAGDPVGYIRLAEFSEVASEQFRTALQTVIDAGTTRIILDLRDNPGGYLSAALSIASEFIGDGVVYMEETSNGKRTETHASGGGLATDPSIRLVVLINKGSASASEILAGALQDRGRAELVGETTFGKGVVQTFIDLSDGSGLKLTIAKWLTPNGTWVHKVGIAPDYPVAPASTQGADDLVLTKALDLLK